MINEVQVRASSFKSRFLEFFGLMLSSRVIARFTWNAIVAFSEQCIAKLVHEVLLPVLYLVVSSALER